MPPTLSYLITGAGGGVSRLVVEQLLSHGEAVRARQHRDDRYNRLTHDVEDLTGRPPQSVQDCIRQRREVFM